MPDREEACTNFTLAGRDLRIAGQRRSPLVRRRVVGGRGLGIGARILGAFGGPIPLPLPLFLLLELLREFPATLVLPESVGGQGNAPDERMTVGAEAA